MKKQFKLKFVLILLTLLIPFSFFLASNTEIANVNSDSLQISQGSTLIFGTTRSPIHMDPHYSWDTGSNNVIDQVVEQLYQFDISDPNLPIVPWLASAMPTISPDGTEYIIPLKTGIKFQDGTDFDATAVKWAFDRLCYFVNYSGNADLPSPFNVPLPSGMLQTQLVYLYEQANGKRVINRTEVLDTYSVKIVTNEPKGSFVSLLCYTGSGILSPTSTQIQGKELDYLTYDDNDVLIGTGPFTYQDYLTDFQVNFNDNPDYWQGAPHLTDLTFSIFDNLADLSSALLTGAVDLVDSLDPSFVPQFEADPDIEIDMDGNTLVCAWTTFNYDHINLAMRRALSWGFNYTYMIDVICEGEVVRWPTYIPFGIPYANYNLNYPTFDIIEARNYLLNDPGYGATLVAAGIDENSPDSAWTDLADTSPLEYLNYTYNIENLRREGIGNRLAYDARYIGVHIDVFGVTWGDFLDMLINYRERMDMYALGWGPDYLDPENYITPLYSDTSAINGGNFYEPDVQQLIDDGLTETDPIAREAIYQEIQRLLVEEYLPAMTLYTPRNYNAWRAGVYGWIPNPHKRLYFYPIYSDGVPPETFIDVSGILGLDGWYLSDISVSLLATDDNSGVAYTEYSFNEIDWFIGDHIDITDDGITTLYYRSVDHVGNIEDTKMETFVKYPRPTNVFIVGTSSGIADLDPHNSWDMRSVDAIDQVVESLFAYNLSAPDCGIIPRLASDLGTWSIDGLNYTVTLKEGITFHDGTPFDATSVKWNFDRIDYFMNISGTLPIEVGETQLKQLFSGYRGLPIINRTEVVDIYTIKFVLNQPYVAVESLLSCWATGILSPMSTPFDNYIDTITGDLVGTGPFVYDEYQEDIGVRFHAYENYWQGPAKLENLWFLVIPDVNVGNDALISGIIDFLDDPLTSMLEGFEIDPNFTVMGGQDTTIRYLGMNNNQINKTMRQAISYAIDYNYIIDNLLEGQGVRLKSHVPEGILYANGSFGVATLDVVKARQILLANGVVVGLDPYDDLQWTSLVDGGTPIATYTYTYNIGNNFRENLLLLLQDNLKQIGIKVEDDGTTWGDFIDRLINNPDTIELFALGWIPDINEPSNFIDAHCFNESIYNFAQVNDPHLEDLMAQGLTETNPLTREAIYDEIQKYLVEDLMPYVYLYVSFDYDVYNSRFTGYQWNPLEKKWFYSVYPSGLDLTPPTWNSGDDTIPSEMNIFYTRNPQIIGSIKIYDSSPISNVQLVNMDPPYNGQPDEGFSLSITHYPQDSNNLYWTDVVVMTTSLLSRGEHHLKLIFYDEQGNVAEKSFVVTVYRQLELKLSGSFDYLEKEKIQISIAAYLVDVETGNPIIPTVSLPLTINVILVNPIGEIFGTFEMEHLGLGVYRYVSESTIDDLKNVLTKGIYLIHGYVEFNVVNHYYSVEEDVIQFHIDPPSGTEPNLWPIFMVGSFGGLIILSVALTFLLLRKRRRNLELK